MKHFAQRTSLTAKHCVTTATLIIKVLKTNYSQFSIMGKCSFMTSGWRRRLKSWLRSIAGNNREAFCSICKRNISVNLMGIKAVRSHMQSGSHRRALECRRQQSVASFCAATTMATTPQPSTTAEISTIATASSYDLTVTWHHANATHTVSVVPQYIMQTPLSL